MKSKVFFKAVNDHDTTDIIKNKLSDLLNHTNIFDSLNADQKAVIKIHFGEEGNTGFVRPEYISIISDRIKKNTSQSFVSDTNTLYKGRRTESIEHKKLAYEHGFTPEISGCEVLIPDETKTENVTEVSLNGRYIKNAKFLKLYKDTDLLINVAHFKGHIMTGFGGALKNLGMGCATREGKLAQHSDVSPLINEENCTGCEECMKVCPVAAITMINNKARLSSSICIGCAHCLSACSYHAVDVNWSLGADTIQEKMIEYTKAILSSRPKKCLHINFAIKITKECDCLAKDDPKIVNDVGIFMSLDPVSIDKACLDLSIAKAGKDIFKEAHPLRDGLKQLKYASLLGIGSIEYDLIEI